MAPLKVNEYEIKSCSIQFKFIKPTPLAATASQYLTLAITNAIQPYMNVSETSQLSASKMPSSIKVCSPPQTCSSSSYFKSQYEAPLYI